MRQGTALEITVDDEASESNDTGYLVIASAFYHTEAVIAKCLKNTAGNRKPVVRGTVYCNIVQNR